MFIGHYGAAFAIKRWRPDISLFTLFIAVQLIDVAWSALVLGGIEKVRIVPGITATNPLDLYYMPYTHSLVAALAWATAGGGGYSLLRRGACGAGLAVGLAVLSHWVLDLVVHRPDLPLYDDTIKVGLGLWDYRWPAFGLEIGLVLGGLALYLAKRRGLDRIGRWGPWVFVGALVAIHSMVFFGRPPKSANQAAVIALVSYVVFAGIAQWIDRHRSAGPERHEDVPEP